MRLKEACCEVLSNLEVLALLRMQDKSLHSLEFFVHQQQQQRQQEQEEEQQEEQQQEQQRHGEEKEKGFPGGSSCARRVCSSSRMQQREEEKKWKKDGAAAPAAAGVSAEKVVAAAAAAMEDGRWPYACSSSSRPASEGFQLCIEKHLLSYTIQRYICKTCRYAEHIPFDVLPAAAQHPPGLVTAQVENEALAGAAMKVAEPLLATAAAAQGCAPSEEEEEEEEEEEKEKRRDCNIHDVSSSTQEQHWSSSSSSNGRSETRSHSCSSSADCSHSDSLVTSAAGEEEKAEEQGWVLSEEQLLGKTYAVCLRNCLDLLLMHFGLYQGELLQVLNLSPLKPVEIYAIVDDCATRLSEAAVNDLLAVLHHYLDEGDPSALSECRFSFPAVAEAVTAAEEVYPSAAAVAVGVDVVSATEGLALEDAAGAAAVEEPMRPTANPAASASLDRKSIEHPSEIVKMPSSVRGEEETRGGTASSTGPERSRRGGSKERRRPTAASADAASAAAASASADSAAATAVRRRRQRSGSRKKNSQADTGSVVTAGDVAAAAGGEAAAASPTAAIAPAGVAVAWSQADVSLFDQFSSLSCKAADPAGAHDGPSASAVVAETNTSAAALSTAAADALELLLGAAASDVPSEQGQQQHPIEGEKWQYENEQLQQRQRRGGRRRAPTQRGRVSGM